MTTRSSATSRRAFLGVAGSVALGSAAACTAGSDPPAAPGATSADPPGQPGRPVAATGRHQAGVRRPNPPQPHLVLAAFDVRTDRPAALLAELGHLVTALTAGPSTELAGLAPGDLTCTLGLGPRLVAGVDPRLPGARELPEYRREAVEPAARGGDLMLQVCASDPLLPALALSALVGMAGPRLVPRWQQEAIRAAPVRFGQTVGAARNLLGFVDGIIGPRSAAELDHTVWLPGPGPVAAGTIAVIRRMRRPATLSRPSAGRPGGGVRPHPGQRGPAVRGLPGR